MVSRAVTLKQPTTDGGLIKYEYSNSSGPVV